MKKLELKEYSLKEYSQAKDNDRIYNFLLNEGSMKGAVVNTTLLLKEISANHQFQPFDAYLLGQAVIGALLMATELKADDRLVLEIICTGEFKGLSVEADSHGTVRGFLKNRVDIEKIKLENINNLQPLMDKGVLRVTRYITGSKQPYIGEVELLHFNIAWDLTNYFKISEQRNSAFNLTVFFDEKGFLKTSGGIFLQAMPGAKEENLISLEKELFKMPSFGGELSKGVLTKDYINQYFEKYNVKFLNDGKRVEFFCGCNKERLVTLFSSMSKEEIKDIIDKEEFPLEVACHNCSTRYEFEKSDLLMN